MSRPADNRTPRPPVPTGEAIIHSGWVWSMNGTPERVALALSRAGWRILYCENPASFIRRSKQERFPLADGLEGFRPRHLGHRLNALPWGAKWQAKLLVNHILRQAQDSGLRNPIVIYPDGDWLLGIAREWKARGFFSVYLNLDYLEWVDHEALATVSDLSLVIPRINYDILKRKLGGNVRFLPQFGPDLDMPGPPPAESPALARVEQIPHPRLAYLGRPANRLDSSLLETLLTAHPEWHFLCCGPVPGLQLRNVHDIGWLTPGELAAISRSIDCGLMPYDCREKRNLHCVPLKLFDYFAAGLPVVSTPLVHLREYGNLVYLGDTAEELAAGVRGALAEPADDSRREKRRRIGREHSISEMSEILPPIIAEAFGRSPDVHSRKGRTGQSSPGETGATWPSTANGD